MPLMKLQVKLQKTAKIMYLANKQTKNNVPPKIFRGFEVRRKVGFMFSRPKNTITGKCYVCTGFKQRNKVCLPYLECKLIQNRYD